MAVNSTSPTAAAARLVRGARSGSADAPQWSLLSSGPTVVWHDARLRSLPRAAGRRPWFVQVVIDGRHARLHGEVWRVPAPALWPWLALCLPFAALLAAVLSRRSPSLVRSTAVTFGVAAATGTLATDIGLALSASAATGRWVELADEGIFALAGLAFVVRGSPGARAIAGGALGLLGLGVALSKFPVLLHGVVLSALPATVARLAVGLTVWTGAAAAICGLGAFFEELEPPAERP